MFRHIIVLHMGYGVYMISGVMVKLAKPKYIMRVQRSYESSFCFYLFIIFICALDFVLFKIVISQLVLD